LVEKTLRLIATLLAIVGGFIGFYLYTHDTPLTILFAGILLSLSLHVTTFERVSDINERIQNIEHRVSRIHTTMVTKEEFERRLAELQAAMVTKEEIERLKSSLRIIVEYVAGNSNILVDFLSIRGVISVEDARYLKTSFIGYKVIVTKAINPLRLSKKEKEAILRIMDLPLEEITEEDCDIAYEALKREMLEGSIEAARMLAILTWIRSYIKFGRKRKVRQVKHEGD